MREINKKEMIEIDGGASFTASMLTAIYKTFEVIFSIGESLGSYIRRKVNNKMCDLWLKSILVKKLNNSACKLCLYK